MTDLRASSLQRGLFYAHSMHPDSSQFNTSAALHIHRNVDAGALRTAWRTLLERHAALRTSYHQREEGVFRRVASVDDAPNLIERVCRGVTDEELFDLVVAEAERPFDLRRGSVRLALFSRAPDDHVLLATAHHLSHDATSSDIVLHELASAYESAVRGAPTELPPCGGTYDDYIEWEAGVLGGERARELEAFWQETLRDPPILELPIDHPRPRVRAGRGASYVSRLDSAALDALRNVSPKTSLYRTLLSVYYVFLWRQTGQRDLVVGTPADMRGRQPVFAHVVGDFTNVMALRCVVDPAQSFRSLLNDVDARVRASSAHRDLPFPRVLEVTPHPRDASRTPIYQTGLNLLRGDLIGHVVRGAPSHMDLGMLSGDVFWLPQQNGLEDLTVVCAVTSTESFVDFKYDVALFEESTIQRMASQFRAVLEACAAAPDEPIATLPIGPGKRQAAAATAAEDAQPAVCAHALVAQWARKTPDAIAVVDGEHRLTYAQLRARASAVARQLRTLGVRPGDSVALSASRRHETFVGLVGILMAGAAYVPIDSSLPEARRARMIARGGVTVGAGYGELAGLVQSEVRLDQLDDLPPSEDEPRGDPGDPMVVLYTSGTTGEPKGVRLPHRGLTSYARAMGSTWNVAPADRVLQFAALSFDASLEEILLAWTAGASLLLRTEEMLDPGKLFDACEANRVTVLDIPTAYLPVAVEAAEQRGWPSALRLVIIGGDRADRTCVERFRRTKKPPRLTSTYGPTEASISVTSCDIAEELDDWPSARSPLGAPVDGCRIYVLDKTFAPAPVGVRGEIFIAGRCLALGYVSDPALTAERFVPDPFAAGERMYRTGDVGIVRPDGRFEFVGRVDDQVKIRGFRIEPAEVATAISRHPTVADALVLVHTTERGEPMLVAYVRPRGEDYDAQALRVFASEHLPAYMVPSALVTIERWPLNAHGKVDHRALPVPEPSRARSEYVAPRSPVEEKLAAIWSEVLGIPQIGVNDDFFALGGHSLSATLVASRVRAAFRVDLPMRCVFEHPTLAALAEDVAALEPGGADAAAPIPRVARDGKLPLSFAERRLWFIDQFDPGAPAYHISVSLRLRGPLDGAAMSSALATLVDRHEALRTRFVEQQGEPARVVDPPARPSPLAADRVDESRLQEWLSKETLRPFDLAKGPLFRTSLAALAPSDHVLVLSMHHIISDGWSVEVMMRELSELYAAAVDQRPAALSVLPIQYADYAAWQQVWLSGERLDKSVAYWRAQLASLPALELPTDRPRPPTLSTAGATHTTKMDAAVVTRLRELGRRKGCSLFMVLLAAFEALLSRYSGQRDFAVGTPEARRDRLETEAVIGFFVNTLVVRAKLEDDPTVLEHLGRVREAMLAAHAHADAPFERLVEELNPVRDPSRSPLFQAMFTFVDTAGRLSKLGDLAIEPARPEQTVAAFELALECTEVAGSVVCAFEYSTALFDASTVERMAAHFQTLVKAMADAPEARVGALPLVGDSERRLLLERSSASTSAGDAECAQAIVRRWARENPKGEALVDGDRRLTYEQLVARASGVATRLRAAGVERGHFVALSAARRLETIVGMLGVWMCGAAYVPIDAGLPEKRRRQMIARCAATVGAGYGDLRGLVQHELRLDEESGAAGSDAEAPCDPRDALVVLYTSGTTGEPKGAVLVHQGVVGYARAVARAWSVTRADRILQFASLSFDASLEEILLAWTSGATLVLRDEAMLDPAKLLDACEAHGITILDVTTAFLPVVVEAAEVRGWPSRLRRVVIGGERPERAAVERLVELEHRPRLASTYGPTEASISVTECELDEELGRWVSGRSPLGNVVEGCRVYVLDAQLALVPVGMPGEICIGGAALARGYAGDPARTAERFVPNPFVPGERIYRTGDVGVRGADGRLEFVGRADDQVKIRGFRIEPSEVAAVLSKHPKVTEAVVIAQKAERGDVSLVGYVRCEREASDAELRSFVGEQLPAYMVPAAIVVVERWPLTPNGKIDHRALPRVELDGLRRDYVAPRTPTEASLAAIWAEVLGVERVGVHDEFFTLGGHSLLAAKLVSRVRRDLNAELSVRALFETPTVAGLAASLSNVTSTGSSGPLIWMRRGSAPRLVLAHALSGDVFAYGPLAQQLDGVEVLGLRARELDPVPAEVAALAKLYADSILQHDTTKPTYLCGWSMGGLVAFETARRLEMRGQPPAGLVLLDTYLLSGGSGAKEPDEVLSYAREVVFELGPEASTALRHALESARDLPQAQRAAALTPILERTLDIEGRELEQRIHTHATLSRAAESYVPGSLGAPIHLIAPDPDRPLRTWRDGLRLASSARVSGDHYSMLRTPHVASLAAALRAIIRG